MEEFKGIKRDLEDKLNSLLKRANAIDDDLSQPHDDDWSEDATESSNDEVLETIGNLTVESIEDIKLALSKIEKKTYGKCEKCGNKISLKRLKAIPFASSCLECCQEA